MKKIYYITIIVFLSFTITGCSKNIALVNEVPISKDLYIQTSKLIDSTARYINKDELNSALSSQLNKSDKSLEKSILTFMINNEIVYQEAIKNGVKATNKEVENKYKELEKAINKNSNYKKIIKSAGINQEYLLQCVSKDITIEKYRNKFKDNIKISDKEIEDYYNNNLQKFNQREIDASHILISTIDKNKNNVNEEEKENLKNSAINILNQINDGYDFEILAKKYSDDKITGKDGGELGYFSKQDKNVEFTTPVFNLKKGSPCKLIETNYGFHIIKINDERVRLKPLEECRQNIEEEILNKKYAEHVKNLSEMSKIRKK